MPSPKGNRILCVCDEGNNRSVHFGHPLKYWGNDVLTLGLNKNEADTQAMLFEWADVILLTAATQLAKVPWDCRPKVLLLDVGEDHYPRPFNPTLARIVRERLAQHKARLDHTHREAGAAV